MNPPGLSVLTAAALGLALVSAGCDKGSRTPAPSASASALALVSPSASIAPLASASPPPRAAFCRALRVVGDARVGEAKLESGAELDGAEWVTLAKDASLTLKHTGSGREVALAGPALFRACRRGREQVLLTRGKVTAGIGMGARPGAEVLIATPVGGVRYAEADFSLLLDEQRLSLEVRAGQVELDAAQPSGKPSKGPLHAKDKLVLPLGKPEPAALMARCQEAAEAAQASARRVGDKAAAEPLAERAQAHVRARQAARSACTVAAAATGLAADPEAQASLWAEAARWEGLWETIPRPVRADSPEK
jgi:hypothetical protein